MNKKIESEIAIGILILVAILVGGAFWMRAEKAQAPVQPVALTPVTQPTQPASGAQTNQAPPQTAVSTPSDNLTSSWGSYGLNSWKDVDLFDMGVTVTVPSDASRFIMTKDTVSDFTDAGVSQGKISVKDKSNKLFGDVVVSASVGTIDQKLSDYLIAQGKITHENYCQKNGTGTLADPKNKTCDTNIKIEKTIDSNIILWSENFIGSPDIISAVVGGRVINFELSQDISSPSDGGGDFTQFMTDIASTLKAK